MSEPAAKKARMGGQLPNGLAMFDLTGKIAVVTGGTGVLGSVMCEGLAAAGAKVAVMGRRAEVAQKVVDKILVRPIDPTPQVSRTCAGLFLVGHYAALCAQL